MLGGVVLHAHRLEEIEPLEKERPLLGEELLGGGQVQDDAIGVDLPEVGVHRGVERQRAGEGQLEIDPEIERRVEQPWARHRRVGELWPHRAPGHEEGRQLEVTFGLEASEPLEQAEARDHRVPGGDGVGLPGNQGRVEDLVGAGHVATNPDAPGASVSREPEDPQRELELRRPAFCIDADPGVPHGVPGFGEVDVGEQQLIAKHSRRVHREVIGRAMVAVGVQRHLEPVGVGQGVATAEVPDDELRVWVEAPDPQVQRPVVEQHPHRRTEVRRLAWRGEPLDETLEGLGVAPGGLVEPPVEHDWPRGPMRPHGPSSTSRRDPQGQDD